MGTPPLPLEPPPPLLLQAAITARTANIDKTTMLFFITTFLNLKNFKN
jgi:hypothetical protein